MWYFASSFEADVWSQVGKDMLSVNAVNILFMLLVDLEREIYAYFHA